LITESIHTAVPPRGKLAPGLIWVPRALQLPCRALIGAGSPKFCAEVNLVKTPAPQPAKPRGSLSTGARLPTSPAG
jgi:hypothetical protein